MHLFGDIGEHLHVGGRVVICYFLYEYTGIGLTSKEVDEGVVAPVIGYERGVKSGFLECGYHAFYEIDRVAERLRRYGRKEQRHALMRDIGLAHRFSETYKAIGIHDPRSGFPLISEQLPVVGS